MESLALRTSKPREVGKNGLEAHGKDTKGIEGMKWKGERKGELRKGDQNVRVKPSLG